MSAIIGLFVRHFLTAAAGAIAMHSSGVDVASITSALMTIGAVVWSVLQKRGSVSGDSPFK